MGWRLDLTCKRVSTGQSEGLLIPRSSVRFRPKLENSNPHGFELHRHSTECTIQLLIVIKAIIIMWRLHKQTNKQGSSRSDRRRKRMSSGIEKERTWLLDGHRDRRACRLWISEPSNYRSRLGQLGKRRQNGSRNNNLNLRRKQKKQQCKVVSLALRDMRIEELMLYLCDNQSLLKAVNRWMGEGGKAMLVWAPDSVIWAAVILIDVACFTS